MATATRLGGKYTIITPKDRAMLNALLKQITSEELAKRLPISEPALAKWLSKETERFRSAARVQLKALTKLAEAGDLKKPKVARRKPVTRRAHTVNLDLVAPKNGTAPTNGSPIASPPKKKHRVSIGIRPLYIRTRDLAQDLEGTKHHDVAQEILRDLALYAMDQIAQAT